MTIVVARSKDGVTGYAVPSGQVVWRRDGPCKAIKTSTSSIMLLDRDTVSLYSVPPSSVPECTLTVGEWSEQSVSPCFGYVALVSKTSVKVVNTGTGKTIFTDTLSSGSGAAVLAPKWLQSQPDTVRFARIGKAEVVIGTIHRRSDLVERQSLAITDGQPAAIFAFESLLFCFVRCKSNQQQSSQLLLIKEDGKVAKSFGLVRADRVDVVASPNNSRFLVVAHADVDQSGKSYYGESFLSIIDANTLTSQRANIGGPFHDVAWMDADRFIALHGFMPAACSVLAASTGNTVMAVSPDADGKPLIGSKNTICCDPKSGLTALAGFGNLPGSVEVWRIDPKSTVTDKSNGGAKVGSFSAPGTTTITWLRHDKGKPALLCATTHPRLRVDNHWSLFSWTGAPLAEGVRFQELYSVSVVSGDIGGEQEEVVDEVALKIAARLNVTAKKAEPYRPPSLRPSTPTTVPPTSTRSKEEKIQKRLQERLDQITELKERRAKGEVLEANQVEKMEREPEVRKELEALMRMMSK